MKGPLQKLQYTGHGNFETKNGKSIRKQIGFVAGGTGIAPCWRLLDAMVRNQDGCSISLLFANHTPEDVLIKGQIDELQKKYPDALKVHYIVTRGGDKDQWHGIEGHITKEMLAQLMPEPSAETMILYSGTKKLNKFLSKTLEDLGYTSDMVQKF